MPKLTPTPEDRYFGEFADFKRRLRALELRSRTLHVTSGGLSAITVDGTARDMSASGIGVYNITFHPVMLADGGFTQWRVFSSVYVNAQNGATGASFYVGVNEAFVGDTLISQPNFVPTVGNHEFDTGWVDIPSAILSASNWCHLRYTCHAAGAIWGGQNGHADIYAR